MLKRRQKEEEKLLQISTFIFSKNKELIDRNHGYVERTAELEGYMRELLDKLDMDSDEIYQKTESIQLLTQALES